ncbi:MAG: cell division protein ZapA [Rhodospirillaceae bacterium]|nr:cell division protein ZapA [Rhodospirillaceae bacterium]MBB57914.1 cell division protein ZapA [Rhodospirillaceae bacterium]|tara:strand:+ start:39889 stop:40350 length:462 start_codon:yes stop_codon:yes gene_type:complete
MAQVTITINGRPHVVGCEDGQEPRLMELATQLDKEVRGIAGAMGQIGDSRLLVISGLSLVDRLNDVESELAKAKTDTPAPQSETASPNSSPDLSADLAQAEERANAAEERANAAEERAKAAEARAAELAQALEAQAVAATKRIDAIAARLQEA